MPSWFDEEIQDEYIRVYSSIVEETRQHILEEHGEERLDDPDLVWEIAQSAPSYTSHNGLEEMLKLSDAVYNRFGREIDWSSCVRRIRQFEAPSGSHVGDYLPTDYTRGAGEEIVLHAVTYEITGSGRS